MLWEEIECFNVIFSSSRFISPHTLSGLYSWICSSWASCLGYVGGYVVASGIELMLQMEWMPFILWTVWMPIMGSVNVISLGKWRIHLRMYHLCFFLKSEKHPPHEFNRVIELRRRGYAVACNACSVSSFSRLENISIKGWMIPGCIYS